MTKIKLGGSVRAMREIFFYGLFMDEHRLRSAGYEPVVVGPAVLADYSLLIESRATLAPQLDAREYGVLMGLPTEQASALYSEPSVTDYVPERVTVTVLGTTALHDCWCYNLPETRMCSAPNAAYRAELSQLLAQLAFPSEYVREVSGESTAT